MTAQYEYLIETGEVAADTADLLSDVQAEYRSALRPDINLSSATPAGTLVAAEVLARSNAMKTAVERANVINPQLSFGTWLESVCAFLGIERGTDRSTVAEDVQVYGTPGTFINSGSRVQSSAGDVFSLVDSVTIPVGGQINASLRAESAGPISLPTGNLIIIDGTIGWGSIASVDGTTTVVLGALALSDVQLKNARNVRLAIQGSGSTASIAARVSAVANVTSVSVIENNTGAVGEINGVTFSLPNAMWVCVAGTPEVQDVADALQLAHAGGCPWDYGATGNGTPAGPAEGIKVVDVTTGKSYLVKYTTPIMYDAYVDVTVKQGTSSTAPVESIQNVMVNYANGLVDGEQGFVVGASVSAFELGGAVTTVLPGLYIKNVAVACVPKGSAAPEPSDYKSEYELNPFEQAALSVGNVKVNLV